MRVFKALIQLPCLLMLFSCAHLFVTSRKIDIEVTGGAGRIELGEFRKDKSVTDTTAYNFNKKQHEFLNQPLTGDPIELERLDSAKRVELLPLSLTYSVTSQEYLYIFIKPYLSQQDITVNVKIDGKQTRRYTLKPDNLGLYLHY